MKNKKDRLVNIITTLRSENTTTLERLALQFNVSTATIRRDIKFLESSNQVFQTVGGGIVYNKDYLGPSREDSLCEFIDEKIRIGEYCTTLIKKQETIIIGPGVTTTLAAKIFSGLDFNFRIITNSISLAYELMKIPTINLYLLGGEVEQELTARSLCPDSLNGVVYADKLFLTADGIHTTYGLTYYSTQQIPIIRQMMNVAKEIILLVDSSKFGKVCFNSLDNLDKVTKIVTDTKVKKSIIRTISNRGIEVVTV